MGKRDIRHHETKKLKKGTKKPLVSDVLFAPPVVEVIKAKGKKEKGAEEEQ